MVNPDNLAESEVVHSRFTVNRSFSARDLLRVFGLAVPIFGGQVSNALAGLIDVVMIGYLGAGMVASVGFGVLVFFVFVSLTMGIESATQTLTARRKGEGLLVATGEVLGEALRISLLIGIPVGGALAFLASDILLLLHDDPTIRDRGADYLAARAISLPFVVSLAAFRGFYNGTSRPSFNLLVALVILVSQVVLNWLLIFGVFGFPKLGVMGAGVAASCASGIGCLVFMCIARQDRQHGVLGKVTYRNQRAGLRLELLRLGLPSGLQWALSWVAMLAFLFFAGQIGVLEADASYLLIQIISLLTLAANSFGLASASLVSQSLGENEPERAYRWGLISGCLAAGILGVVGFWLAVFSGPLLSVLNSNASLVVIAEPILIICGLVASLDAFGIVMNFSLIGAGAVKRVMVWNLAGMWVICLPAAWLFGVLQASNGVSGLWGALLGARLIVAVVMFFTFYQRQWVS